MRLLTCFLFLMTAAAHELQDNRATLVLRDNTHLSVTLFVSYTEALHQSLAPKRALPEFLLMYSAMPPEELERQLVRAQAILQEGTRILVSPSQRIPLTNWVWPTARQVQAILQQRLMQAIASPDTHAHEEPVEIHAEAIAAREIESVQVQFAEEFQNVLVVAYRPTQRWVEAKSLSGPIVFSK